MLAQASVQNLCVYIILNSLMKTVVVVAGVFYV